MLQYTTYHSVSDSFSQRPALFCANVPFNITVPFFYSFAVTNACLSREEIASVFVQETGFRFEYISGENESTVWPREPFMV